jgi:hypothetical protein
MEVNHKHAFKFCMAHFYMLTLSKPDREPKFRASARQIYYSKNLYYQ